MVSVSPSQCNLAPESLKGWWIQLPELSDLRDVSASWDVHGSPFGGRLLLCLTFLERIQFANHSVYIYNVTQRVDEILF